jgi:trimeric autotransporter adhesin
MPSTPRNVSGKSLTGEDIAAGAIGAAQLQDLGVGTGDLANGAVTGPKLAPLSISSSKILPSAVTGTKIAANAVDGDEIADGTVAQNDIGSSPVDASELGAITERSAQVIADNGEFAQTTVACTASEQVISGGHSTNFPASLLFPDSRRSGNGWTVETFNPDDLGGTVSATAYAYCLNPGS